MKCVVFTHKKCWRIHGSDAGYATDGGFPKQMHALAGLFDELIVACPITGTDVGAAGTRLDVGNVRTVPLPPINGSGLRRRLYLPFWILRAMPHMLRLTLGADVVHCPIPGDIGTIGLLLAWVLRKHLFVRHCGNWDREMTIAERFWKWFMCRYGGGKNVMLATGLRDDRAIAGGKIRWIFSSSLWEHELRQVARGRNCPLGKALRIGIACRQVRAKGTSIVIEAAKKLLAQWPELVVEVIGDGPDLGFFRQLSEDLGMSDHVRFCGLVPHEEVLKRLAELDIFCLPSSSEGFPKAVLEAMACGVPCVTSRVSALAKLADYGGAVALDEISPVQVALAIRDCVQPGTYEKMSVRAIECAMHFTLEKWREEIARILGEQWEDFGFGAQRVA